MSLALLRATVESFAAETIDLPVNYLDSEGYNWDEYPGVRMAHLHTALLLRELAGRLLVARQQAGLPITRAHAALLDHQRAFRDMQALLIKMPEEHANTIPAPEEWPLHKIVVHLHYVERYFFASIRNALAGREAREPSDAEAAEWADEPEMLPTDLPLAETLAAYAGLHARIQSDLVSLSDAEVALPSSLWESQPRPILFRIERWAAHLREHTNQLEKTLRWLQLEPAEGKMLVRQTYAALAEVEGLALGAEALADGLCTEANDELARRYSEVRAALVRVQAFLAAIEAGDQERVRELLARTPDLAGTPLADGTSPLVYSVYRGRSEIVAALQAANPYPNFFESAIVGNLERVTGYLDRFPDLINQYTRDGYTPLQLAAFFGHEEIVRVLLARGADPHAVARNAMRIQALHAATAARNATIVAALIAAGADVHARQQDDFTPLMAATQNGDQEIVDLLRAAGAGQGQSDASMPV